MTIFGWILFILFSFVIYLLVSLIRLCMDDQIPRLIHYLISIFLILCLLAGMLWYYDNTEDGARAMKSQYSNLNGGIHQIVKVYDRDGDLIEQYEGKFDIGYNENGIIFNDDNNKRHIISYSTGTIIIDEK